MADVYRDERLHGRSRRNAEEGWTREKASQTRELVETAVSTEVVSGCGRGVDEGENELDKGRTEEGDLEVTWQRGAERIICTTQWEHRIHSCNGSIIKICFLQ